MDRRKRNRSDRIEYRGARRPNEPDQTREPGSRRASGETPSAQVDRNATTLKIWHNEPPDQLYPDDDRRS